jgi:fido (protein-threonine AMPylation protein)
MPEDLPIYSGSPLRTSLQFAALEKLKGIDASSVWQKSDACIAQMEGAIDVTRARQFFQDPTKERLCQLHSILFNGRDGAGQLRHSAIAPLYRGHDCPEPQFIDRSLDNFLNWLPAESISEIHPIEKAALVLSRMVDIWPFEYGNLTVAIMFANVYLRDAGFTPFFVEPKDMKELNTIIAQAMSIETQPLINAIFRIVKREMEAVASR